MKQKYDPVYLSKADRKRLKDAEGRQSHSRQIRVRAQILLALDENSGPVREQAEIAAVLKASPSTVRKVARLYCKEGIDAVLTRKKREIPPVPAKVTGEVEARVVQIACSNPPEGFSRWSLRLMEDRIAAISDMPDLSDSTIGRLLKNLIYAMSGKID